MRRPAHPSATCLDDAKTERIGSSGVRCSPRSSRLRPPHPAHASYVTLRVYEGIPLTQIGREVGTRIRMMEQQYAGVIANWDGKQRSAEFEPSCMGYMNGCTCVRCQGNERAAA
jgi:hypothetical protein